jgi:hypothetical protein
MAAPSALRTNYSDLFGTSMLPVLEEVFKGEYNQHKSVRELLFKSVKHDRDIWQYSEMHDMPLFSSVAEGADYTMSRPKQGSDKTLTVVKYGLGFSISEEAVADGKFAFISDAVRKMGRSAFESKEVSAMNVLNNGFGSATTADGLSLFNDSHITPTGTYTISNVLAAAADLSDTSLKTAIGDFEKNFKGDSGIIYRIRPKYLVVPSALRLAAIALVNSDLQAGTSNNDMNAIKGEGLQVISSPHLTDADAWFLIGDQMDNGLRVIERQALETSAADPSVGWLNDSILYKARYREVVGAVHPMGVFGTPGA